MIRRVRENGDDDSTMDDSQQPGTSTSALREAFGNFYEVISRYFILH